MSRPLSELSQKILMYIKQHGPQMLHQLYKIFTPDYSKKQVYDTLFRLNSIGFTEFNNDRYSLGEEAEIVLHTIAKERDGVWKLVIFDIPEAQRQVRTVLRAKLVSLGFKKWQNSIWISPYTLAPDIENELNQLAKHYFIRLIKTTDINHTKDLDKLFE